LYVSRFNGEFYLLDGSSIRSCANGTNDIFFFDNWQLWEPYTYLPKTPKGEFDTQIIESVNFVESDLSVKDQQLFLKLWVMAVFFGNVQPTKIILLLLGEHGAGKKSALRRIQKLIFGHKVAFGYQRYPQNPPKTATAPQNPPKPARFRVASIGAVITLPSTAATAFA
jgi:hypothetical protein